MPACIDFALSVRLSVLGEIFILNRQNRVITTPIFQIRQISKPFTNGYFP